MKAPPREEKQWYFVVARIKNDSVPFNFATQKHPIDWLVEAEKRYEGRMCPSPGYIILAYYPITAKQAGELINLGKA